MDPGVGRLPPDSIRTRGGRAAECLRLASIGIATASTALAEKGVSRKAALLTAAAFHAQAVARLEEAIRLIEEIAA
jgi:hypothetical protein